MAKRATTSRGTRPSGTPDSASPVAGIEAPPISEKAWRELKSALASVLSDLDEDEYLVIEVKSDGSFVQFAGQGAHGMRAEAVSNAYLPETSNQLSNSACDDLVKLGWNPPTYIQVEGVAEPADGSSNFYLDAATPVPYSKLAALAVESLRRIYLVRHPGELEYTAYDREATSIRFPSLKLRRRRSELAPVAVETGAAASRRAKRASQDGEQTADAQSPGREPILEVVADGGSLSILRTRAADGAWRFVALRDETTLTQLLDEDDQQGLSFSDESGSVDTFAAALQVIGRYPWHRLMPLKLHEEYAAVVMAEVLRRGGTRETARWKSALSRRSDRL